MVQKTYDRQTAKFIAVVAENLPELSGMRMQRWIGDPKGLQKTLHMALNPFQIWKTVKLGIQKTPDEYRNALKKACRRIGDLGDDILGRIICSQQETEVDLVVLSVAELGFKGSARYADICTKAVEIGLELCPAEVGPALRLQYGDQPRDEWLRIAMEAITAWGGDRYIFAVDQGGGGLWLGGSRGNPDRFWDADYRFVFVRRKS